MSADTVAGKKSQHLNSSFTVQLPKRENSVMVVVVKEKVNVHVCKLQKLQGKDIKKNKRMLMTKFVPEIAASSQQKRGILDYIE